MTILITGATGNVGRPLVSQLLSAGHRVRALTRNPSRAGLPAEAEVVAGDLADTASLADAFAGVTALHLIGFGSDYEPLTNAPDIVDLAVSSECGRRRSCVVTWRRGRWSWPSRRARWGRRDRPDLGRAREARLLPHRSGGADAAGEGADDQRGDRP